MAEVHVSNWAEFVDSVAVSGDTVILPDAERWDMNDIAPEGVSGNIPVNCSKILGNGTQILNGHFYGAFQVAGTEIDDLHIINFLGGASLATGTGVFERCMISGLSSGAVPLWGASWNRCAFNIETQYASDVWAVAGACSYCRIIFHAANATGATVQSRNSAKTNCEIILYMPVAQTIYLENMQYCTVRGNMQSCRTIGRYQTEYSSVCPIVNIDNLSSGANVKSNMIGVTDAQMKDASYLQSIGFPIGGDEE